MRVCAVRVLNIRTSCSKMPKDAQYRIGAAGTLPAPTAEQGTLAALALTGAGSQLPLSLEKSSWLMRSASRGGHIIKSLNAAGHS